MSKSLTEGLIRLSNSLELVAQVAEQIRQGLPNGPDYSFIVEIEHRVRQEIIRVERHMSMKNLKEAEEARACTSFPVPSAPGSSKTGP